LTVYVVVQWPDDDLQLRVYLLVQWPDDDLQLAVYVVVHWPDDDLQLTVYVVVQWPYDDLQLTVYVVVQWPDDDLQLTVYVVVQWSDDDLQYLAENKHSQKIVLCVAENIVIRYIESPFIFLGNLKVVECGIYIFLFANRIFPLVLPPLGLFCIASPPAPRLIDPPT